MKKIINGRKYDTSTATKIDYCDNGYYHTDFQHACETLYRKRNGEYFLHAEGGPLSEHATVRGDNRGYGESIAPLTIADAKDWAQKKLDGDEYESIFGVVTDADDAPRDKQILL